MEKVWTYRPNSQEFNLLTLLLTTPQEKSLERGRFFNAKERGGKRRGTQSFSEFNSLRTCAMLY
jgi:hypothetical protein